VRKLLLFRAKMSHFFGENITKINCNIRNIGAGCGRVSLSSVEVSEPWQRVGPLRLQRQHLCQGDHGGRQEDPQLHLQIGLLQRIDTKE
jgi:hypothetical protein